MTPEALPVLAEVVRLWQEKGAGPLVKPHGFFTGSTCPGPDLRSWLDLSPHPWLTKETTVPKPPVKDETPDWLMDFVHWRLALNGDKKRRPPHVPPRIPETAWEAAAQVDRIVNLMGPQDTFLDWAEWRRQGAKKAERPRSAPATIPKSWWEALARLEQIFKGVKTAKKPAPKKKEPAKRDEGPVTARSELLAPPRAPLKTLERYMLRRQHGGYSDDDVRDILRKYAAACKRGPRPAARRQPDGARDGEPDVRLVPAATAQPGRDRVTGAPGAGISFSNWDKAVDAHVGRLLAYALPKGEGTEAQRTLIDRALKVRPLPDDRAAGRDAEGAGRTWAMDPKYADKISGIANEIRQRAWRRVGSWLSPSRPTRTTASWGATRSCSRPRSPTSPAS